MESEKEEDNSEEEMDSWTLDTPARGPRARGPVLPGAQQRELGGRGH